MRVQTWNPTPEQLLCRDLHHAWAPKTAKRVRGGFVRTLRCPRCTAEKTQTLDRSGYVIRTSMYYPDGYLRPEGRLTKDDRASIRVGNIL